MSYSYTFYKVMLKAKEGDEGHTVRIGDEKYCVRYVLSCNDRHGQNSLNSENFGGREVVQVINEGKLDLGDGSDFTFTFEQLLPGKLEILIE